MAYYINFLQSQPLAGLPRQLQWLILKKHLNELLGRDYLTFTFFSTQTPKLISLGVCVLVYLRGRWDSVTSY